MDSINFLAVIVVTLIAFVMSTGYYIVFGKTRNQSLGVKQQTDFRPAPAKVATELLRTFILCVAVAILLAWTQRTTAAGGLELAFVLWVAFPGILLWGSVMWDKVPTKLALIHAGDWLLKLALMGLVLGGWH
jgi:hypothetical protein